MKQIESLSDEEFAARLREAVALPDAPPALLRSAIGLWPAVPTGARAALRRLLATLAFDCWAPAPGQLAVRGARSASRQLLFSAEGRDVDLRIVPVDGAFFALAGQVLGPDEAGRIEVRDGALRDGSAAWTAVLGEQGEFRLDAIPAGSYSVTLHVGDVRIDLPALDVGHAGA